MPQSIIEFKLEGFEELRAELLTLSKNVQRKGANTMANAGAELVRNEAKKNAVKVASKESEYFSYIEEGKGEYAGMTIGGRSKWGGIRTQFRKGHVRNSIFMGKSKKSRNSQAIWRVFLGPQAWFGRFLEYGFTSHGVTHPPVPFIRPAVKNNISQIIDVMRKALGYFLLKEHYKRLQVKA